MDEKHSAGALEEKLMPWAAADDPVLALALRELAWYEKRKSAARFYYQASELALLLATAATTVAAALAAPPIATAILAAITLFLTGYRQTFDPHGRWLACAQGWVQIREAVWQYRLGDGAAKEPGWLLERLQAISREELGQWLSAQRSRRPRDGVATLGDHAATEDQPSADRGRAGAS